MDLFEYLSDDARKAVMKRRYQRDAYLRRKERQKALEHLQLVERIAELKRETIALKYQGASVNVEDK